MLINKIIISIIAVLLPLLVAAQSVSVVRENKQQKFHKQMPAGNYSGVAYLGNNRYAVVDDKSEDDGYYIFNITIDTIKGKILTVSDEGFVKTGNGNTDLEGIAYNASQDSVYTIGERNTGKESLSYNEQTHRFWTTTEAPMPEDGMPATPENGLTNRMRLKCYDDNMTLAGEYLYEMDKPTAKSSGRNHVFGVSELCALDDGSVLVLEREFRLARTGIGTWCKCKLYIVNPKTTAVDNVLKKSLLWESKTRLNVLSRSLANYEGMCLGPRLSDGRRLLLLIADSQYRHKGVMKDWLKTLVITDR